MKLEFGYGHGVQTVEVPEKNLLDVLVSNPMEHERRGADAVRYALENPIGAAPLRELAKPGQKIAIITSDISRPLPSYDVLPSVLDELYAAGLLHDVAKELSREAQLAIMKQPSEVYTFEKEDLCSETLYHGFCAPYIILRDFPRFGTDEILKAVCFHTVGREGMSLFEKIIFLNIPE